MPGFGAGPWGRNPFGEWGWSENVLYQSAPTVYRTADAASGDFLRKYAAGQAPSFDNLRHKIAGMGSLRDPFAVRSAYSQTEFLLLGKQIIPTGNVEQAGNLGRAVTYGIFTAGDRSARFRASDVGKQLTITRSTIAGNNGQTFTVSSIVGEKEVLTDPPMLIDAGPMRWELRGRTEIPADQVEVELRGGDPRSITPGWSVNDGSNSYEVLSRQMFWQPVTQNRMLTERDGIDGTISTRNTLSAPSYSFQIGDIGKLVSISGSSIDQNNGLFEIVAVDSGDAIFGVLTVNGANGDPQGTVQYRNAATADRPVSVRHLKEPQALLPLEISYSTVSGRFDVTIRLATDINGDVVTTPSDIEAAVAADPTVVNYLDVLTPIWLSAETAVAEFSQTVIKAGRMIADAGPLEWSIRPFPRLVLQGSLPLGVLEVEGYDLAISTTQDPADRALYRTAVSSASTPFTSGDVGKLLTIAGSAFGNDGTYSITEIRGGGSIAVVQGFLAIASAESGLYFGLRTAPNNIPDPTRLNSLPQEVEASSEPLLNYLAKDFGVEVDTQQTEDRQRAWVRQVSQWTAVKGTLEAVQGIAALSGFTASVEELTAISAFPTMGTGSYPLGYTLVFVAERNLGTGSLSLDGYGEPLLTAASGSFSALDVGKVVRFTGSGSGNNNHYVIAEVVSATVVRLLSPSIGANLDASATALTVPDASASLTGTLGQVYGTLEPEFLSMDEINFDVLSDMYDLASPLFPVGDRPGIDYPCSAAHVRIGNAVGGATGVVSLNPPTGLQITSVVTTGLVHTVTISGEDLVAVLGGNWSFEDSAGVTFYMDGVPTLVSSSPYVWTVQTTATTAPSVGGTFFEYLCPLSVNCDICPSYRLLITLTKNGVEADGPVANDRAFDRVIRLIEGALPANAEASYVLTQPLVSVPLMAGVTGSTILTY